MSVVLYMSISVDGFVAGPDDDLDHGLGVDGEPLRAWLAAGVPGDRADAVEAPAIALAVMPAMSLIPKPAHGARNPILHQAAADCDALSGRRAMGTSSTSGKSVKQ